MSQYPEPAPGATAGQPRSAAQIEASRRNGARSRGPRTPEGKARSAANARRHGLRSPRLMLRGEEEREAFAALHADLEGRFGPVGELEGHLVEELATIAWRQRMLRTVEVRALEALSAGEPAGGLPSLATLCRYRARLERDWRRVVEELEALQEERRRLGGIARMANPAQLRWLAGVMEQRRRESGTNEPGRREAEGKPPRDREAALSVSAAARRVGGTNEPAVPRRSEEPAPSSRETGFRDRRLRL